MVRLFYLTNCSNIQLNVAKWFSIGGIAPMETNTKDIDSFTRDRQKFFTSSACKDTHQRYPMSFMNTDDLQYTRQMLRIIHPQNVNSATNKKY